MCSKSYHVRCAVRKGMIKEWEEFEEIYGQRQNGNDDWYTPLFCDEHEEIGVKAYKEGGKEKLVAKCYTQAGKERMKALG